MKFVSDHYGQGHIGRRYRAYLIVAVVLVGWLAGGCSRQNASEVAQPNDVPALSKDQLERTKLAEEIRAIQGKEDRDSSISAAILQWAPFATVFVALAGAGLTLRTQRKDHLAERRKRHDEELARVVQNIGSAEERVRLNSAAALTAFLGPDGPDLQLDLLAIIIANLKIETSRTVSDVLVHDLEIALRECLRGGRRIKELDLARSQWLCRLDLSDLKLTGIPIDLAFANLRWANFSGLSAPRAVRGFGAELSNARLSLANLHLARLNSSVCVGASFHRARLVSATFKDSDMRTAQFQQADLQSAHFERAQLQGADFTEADVTDTWFCDAQGNNAAILDGAALRSLARARRSRTTREPSWRNAHLAPAARTALEIQLRQRGQEA